VVVQATIVHMNGVSSKSVYDII